jgi:hypothetical protein
VTFEDDQPIPLLDGEPAFLLDEGIAYVRGWTTAQRSVAQLKDVLAEAGHEDVMPYLRADVNVFGAGIVELGRVTPETADLIAHALRLIVHAQLSQTGNGHAA